MGRVELDGLLPASRLALRSFRQAEYGAAHIELHCGFVFTCRFKVETQTARVVLDRYDPHRGAPCLIDLVCSLDHKMGSSLGYCRDRLSRFLPDTLGSFSRRKTDGRPDDR